MDIRPCPKKDLLVRYSGCVCLVARMVTWLIVLCLSSGTHGYMAPEVLAKGVAYDSSADWFSFGCMLYKLLRGFVADLLSSVLIGLKLV